MENEQEQTKTEEKSAVERAEEVLAQIKEERENLDKRIAVENELRSERMLSGQSEAGHVPEKPQPLTDAEFLSAFEKGELNLFTHHEA